MLSNKTVGCKISRCSVLPKPRSPLCKVRVDPGSTRVLVVENGTVAAYYDYAPFGNLMRSGVNTEIAYRFTGQEYDAESGLHNYRARLYDSDLGRFYAVDAPGSLPRRWIMCIRPVTGCAG